jgi:molybdopterin converting factor small subunit
MRLAGLPEDEVFVIIVNGRTRVTADHLLARGDEVTFVPPVAGG